MTIVEQNLERCSNLILGKSGCPYCEDAIRLLAKHSKTYLYIPKEKNADMVSEIKDVYKHATFPAVFINNKFVGGCDKLKEFIKNGNLDESN
ncbi:hypothetical protein COBT_001287 [Conglomerata obtusa]